MFLGTLCYSNIYCQQSDFCDAVTTIMRDAPNKFRNIKGKVLQSNISAVIWDCGVKVPGTISSRFVLSMGSFYEGAFFQTREKEEIKTNYDNCKDRLVACLAPQGYTMSLTANFYAGLEAYKKIVFMKEPGEGKKIDSLPPHIAMEVVYNKDAKNYTIIMYIFEQ